MFLRECPDQFQILFQLMESHLPQILSFLEKLSDMKVIHPDQYLVHPAQDLGKFLLPSLQDLYLNVVDPMTGEIADAAKLKSSADELKRNLCANDSFAKLSVAVANEKCMMFLQALGKEFPELEAEQRRLSLLLPGIQAQAGTTSTSSTTVRMQDLIVSAAGSKNSEEEEDTAVHCPILGGKPRAIYAQSIRPMYERKDQGTLQTSSGKKFKLSDILSIKQILYSTRESWRNGVGGGSTGPNSAWM